MPHPTAGRAARRSSGGERVFNDESGRLWSASLTEEAEPASAIVFACISDSRQQVRAIARDAGQRLDEASDDELRGWLRDAPRIGRLT